MPLRRHFLIPALALLAAATSAGAAEKGIYVGAGITKAQIDDIGDVDSFDIDNTAWKAIVGFRPLDVLAVEANYLDLGSENATIGPVSAEADAKAFGAYGLVFLPIPIVDVFAKAGLVRWELNGRTTGGTGLFQLDDDGTDFAYGAGAQFNLGRLCIRGEYERFDIDNTDGLELWSLSALYTF